MLYLVLIRVLAVEVNHFTAQQLSTIDMYLNLSITNLCFFFCQKWVPLHGYKRAAAEKEKDWLLEVPQNADPYIDRFDEKLTSKKEKVAKNEFQRLRNIAAARKIKVPRVGILPSEKLPADQVFVLKL